jgi:glycerol-3-phosphate dehydrogenase
MPIAGQVARLLFEGIAPKDAYAALMARERKAESTDVGM